VEACVAVFFSCGVPSLIAYVAISFHLATRLMGLACGNSQARVPFALAVLLALRVFLRCLTLIASGVVFI
jgi:hypothetical protein